MNRFLTFLLLGLVVLAPLGKAIGATIEWDFQKSIDIGSTPLDIVVSPDGKSTYILTDNGKILVYSAAGVLVDNIDIGHPVDGIELSRDGSQMYLSSKAQKKVDVINLDFVYDINVAGSPFKGPADAPVVIAVFSDFQ